jgi:SAM-dependent methyltransferase
MFLFLISQIARGNSLARALMHYSVRGVHLSGSVLDVGGGRGASYLPYLKHGAETEVVGLDLVPSSGVAVQINFETDPLPRPNASVDQVLMFNILEHIYHHQFLISEAARVLKPGGTLIGFVPFLINYHPDPHDYFRYTKEALKELFTEQRFSEIDIQVVGGGPLLVNCNNLMLFLPRLLRAPFFSWYYVFDLLMLRLRPRMKEQFPLGFMFLLKK